MSTVCKSQINTFDVLDLPPDQHFITHTQTQAHTQACGLSLLGHCIDFHSLCTANPHLNLPVITIVSSLLT